jgi:hypothetical protein
MFVEGVAETAQWVSLVATSTGLPTHESARYTDVAVAGPGCAGTTTRTFRIHQQRL